MNTEHEGVETAFETAWRAITKEVEKIDSDWHMRGSSGINCVLNIIRSLASWKEAGTAVISFMDAAEPSWKQQTNYRGPDAVKIVLPTIMSKLLEAFKRAQEEIKCQEELNLTLRRQIRQYENAVGMFAVPKYPGRSNINPPPMIRLCWRYTDTEGTHSGAGEWFSSLIEMLKENNVGTEAVRGALLHGAGTHWVETKQWNG